MKRALTSCKPTKMWIDGKCFEIKKFQKKGNKSLDSCLDSSPSLEKYAITADSEGNLFTTFKIPQAYLSKLTNFPHFDVKTLETSTSTSISITRSGNLRITGESEAKVAEARDEIHSVIGAIRDQCIALQFVSIPTLNEGIIANFAKFKESILNDEGAIDGMEESIFQSPHKLHLTIVVFSLLDESEKTEAVKALQEYKETILDPLIKKTGPLKIRISGIDCMNQNLRKVDVLYAKASIVDGTEESDLQKIANELSDHFYERGLVRRYQDNVKLHMTLINTRYRNKSTDSPKKKKRWIKRQSFDATTIMEKYRDFEFGECPLNSIHLSIMSTIGEDGYYKPISIINVEDVE